MRIAAAWDEGKYQEFVDRFWSAAMAHAHPPWLSLTVHTEAPVSRQPEIELHAREDDDLGNEMIEGFKAVFGTTWLY